MINFLIWSPGFTNNSGGVIALHRLADIIAKFGEKSYIFTSHTYEGSSAIVINEHTNINLIDTETMVIYPEIINGNPFGSTFVTRWLLNSPGKIGGDGVYGESDLIYKYLECIKAPDESKVKGELRAFTLKLDKFFNQNLSRIGECYIIKKGYHKNLNKHKEDSINIDSYPNDEYLSDIFNKTEKFISYDSLTFLNIQAALCGCISIVIPDEGVTREEFINKNPIFKYGVAYGLDDIEHAKTTLHLVRSHIENMEKESFDLIQKYISDCYTHMNIQK